MAAGALLAAGTSQTSAAVELGVSRSVIRRVTGPLRAPRRPLLPSEADEIRDLVNDCPEGHRGSLNLSSAAGDAFITRALELHDLGVPLTNISRAAGYKSDWLRQCLARRPVDDADDTERAWEIERRLRDRDRDRPGGYG